MKNINTIFMYTLGALIVLGFFVLMIFLVLNEVPAPNANTLNLVVGALIGAFTAVVGYFFGSSMGSKQKTDIMAKNGKQ